MIISKSIQEMYPFAYSLLDQFVGLLTEVLEAQISVEKWAAAICSPFGVESKTKDSTCTAAEENLVKLGLAAFDKDFKQAFVENVKDFKQRLAEKDFVTLRKASVYTDYRDADDECGVQFNHTHMERAKTTFSEHKDLYMIADVYDFKCPESKLKETCKGLPGCKIKNMSEVKGPQNCEDKKCLRKEEKETNCDYTKMIKNQPCALDPDCTKKDKKKKKKCDKCTYFKCADCGFADCDRENKIKVDLQFDHLNLYNNTNELENAWSLLAEKAMAPPPPYRLDNLEDYTLDFDLRN